MTVAFLRSCQDEGAEATEDDVGYQLRWPDGTSFRRAVFTREEAETGGTTLLSLEHHYVRVLSTRIPLFAPGQPLLGLVLDGISDKVSGTWSLWRIALRAGDNRTQRVLPLFSSDDGRVLAPTARAIWDRLIDLDERTCRMVPVAVAREDARSIYDQVREQAEVHGRHLFEELIDAHRERVQREREKGNRAFAARRRSVERIGLPQVRKHRLDELEKEEAAFLAELQARGKALPELTALVLIRVARPGEIT